MCILHCLKPVIIYALLGPAMENTVLRLHCCLRFTAGFTCVCDEDSQWVVNTDTGLCTTYACEGTNAICMNEAQCSVDMEDPANPDATCQCRDYNLDENCEIRK